MGEPYFQIKRKLKQHGIVPFSSNYALYGDMSERVMSLIEAMRQQSRASESQDDLVDCRPGQAAIKSTQKIV
ncbi:ImpB/MucB/SamB family protein [Pseudomonas fluorescens]|uniref:ImpB/MucB/SamB family protein n=1 Tax=Pseudomonas fluorescens TaxID=294 RepID=A0A3M3XST4_PSEFL|nr:hypothetical protein ALQ35_02619 [Pseudomonas fluorescens]SQF91843.1 ImpB/MucB/SamB family protein [Pseudomonas fluorescens]